MTGETMSAKRAVAVARAVFVGLLVVQLFSGMAAVWFVSYRPNPQAVDDHPWGLYSVGAMAFVVLAVAGYLTRRRMYRRGRREDGTVQPGAYLWGNLAVLVPVAVMGLVGLALAVAAGSLYPALLITMVALIVQVINMPTGDPLEPGRYAKDQTPNSA